MAEKLKFSQFFACSSWELQMTGTRIVPSYRVFPIPTFYLFIAKMYIVSGAHYDPYYPNFPFAYAFLLTPVAQVFTNRFR